MKKTLVFFGIVALAVVFTPFASAMSYTYYSGPDAIGTPISCEPMDPQGDYILCYVVEEGDDKSFGIVVDEDWYPTGPYITDDWGNTWGHSGYIQL